MSRAPDAPPAPCRFVSRPGLAAAALLAALPAAAQTGPSQVTPVRPAAVPDRGAPARVTRVTLEAGQGRMILLDAPAGSLFAADPKVAEVRPASQTSMFLMAVGPGRTTVAAMDEAGRPVGQWEVTVRPSSQVAAEAQSALRSQFRGSALRVEAGPSGFVLSGDVASAADAERAVALLRTRAGDDRVMIDNRLSVLAAQQVNLRVRIAEISREVTRQLGFNWTALGSVGRFGVAAATATAILDAVGQPSQVALGYRGAVNVDAVVDALAQDRLITILAEPNLTAMSGETASFLAGGEFPIPVSQRDRNITIEFKQFGVSLAFVPTVTSEGRISLRVKPEVSELSEQGAVKLPAGDSSITIPALTVRRAETSVELGSGQSFAIAGLLQDTARLSGRGLPQVSEIPIIGSLLRSDRFQRNETELVIIITPYLVRAADSPAALMAPTDGWRPPGDRERIVQQRQQASPRPVASGALRGNPGFVLD